MEKSSFRVDEKLRHIAFIMDGNGRWARQRGMPREYGHGVGARVFRRVIRYCGDIGITAVTVYRGADHHEAFPELSEGCGKGSGGI